MNELLSIPKHLLDAVREGNCVLYAGAGFSLEARLPDGERLPTGKGLGHRMAQELYEAGYLAKEPQPDQSFNFAALAENYETAFGRHNLILLLNEIYAPYGLQPTEAHHLAIKHFSKIITTNYDSLFEQSSYMQGKRPIVITRDSNLSLAGANSRPTIYKIHGDLNEAETIVVTNEDYRHNPLSAGVREKLASILSEKIVLFIGCGLEDSDLQEIYYSVQDRLGKLMPRAFMVTPFPDKDSLERNQWNLFCERWQKNGIQFINSKAREFLQQLDNSLTEKKQIPLNMRESGAGKDAETSVRNYRERLKKRVGTIHIFGEGEAQALEKIFVELNVIEEYRSPSAHSEYWGLMDSEMRRKRQLFSSKDVEKNDPQEQGERIRRTIGSDELLREGTKALITGAPGSGKTTLLRYLAHKINKDENDKRLPVFVELKEVTASDFDKMNGHLAKLLFDKSIVGSVELEAIEREQLKEIFFAKLKIGEVAIFLDGLDEVRSRDVKSKLQTSVNEFNLNYKANTLIVSTRPYAMEPFDGLNEMEIAPLNQHQIKQLLKHYYPDEKTENLLKTLRQRNDLREMARVPFLLSTIVGLYREEEKIVGNRLELYRQLVHHLAVKLDKDKQVAHTRFQIPDKEGLLKLDFLKQLAFELLLIDISKSQREVERLVFTGEELLKKAERFVIEKNLSSHINPYLLAADLKASPLLREVGADVYAFTHLTIMEYLAAKSLAEREPQERKKNFCRAYFDTALVEMEVLPMTLGLIDDADEFYEEIKKLPESLTYAGLRLRARGLRYEAKINKQHLGNLSDELLAFVKGDKYENQVFREVIEDAFVGSNGKNLNFLVEQIEPLLKRPFDGIKAYTILGKLGGERAIELLVKGLQSKDGLWAAFQFGKIGGSEHLPVLREALKNKTNQWGVVSSLKDLGEEQVVPDLLEMMKNSEELVRWDAAEALAKIQGEKTERGLRKLMNEVNPGIHTAAAYALGLMGDESAIAVLRDALKDKRNNLDIRWRVANALGKIGDEKAVDSLLEALRDEVDVRRSAINALSKIRGGRSINGLIAALKAEDAEDNDIHWRVAQALGDIGDPQAVSALIEVLNDNRFSGAQWRAAEALGKIGGNEAKTALFEAMKNSNQFVGRSAAVALGRLGEKGVLSECLAALDDKDDLMRWRAAEALENIGDEGAAEALIKKLRKPFQSDGGYVGERAAEALVKLSIDDLVNGLSQSLFSGDIFVRQKAVQIVGYYSNDSRVLEELSRLATTDPISEVRSAASEAQEKFLRKLQLFYGEEDVIAEAEEKERAKTLEENRAFIAHELKNSVAPLAAFANYLSEYLDNDAEKEKLKDLSKRILKQAYTVSDVVNLFVEYSKPFTPRFVQTDINALLADSLDEITVQCESHSIQIQRSFEQGATALVDRDLIKQVFRNLLLNAIEAIEHDGIITITTKREINRLVIKFSDTGKGINPQYISRIFDLGFTTKAGKRGAGVGLALAKRIITEPHKGQISIENNIDGKGTTLTIELPVFEKESQNGR